MFQLRITVLESIYYIYIYINNTRTRGRAYVHPVVRLIIIFKPSSARKASHFLHARYVLGHVTM